MSVKNILVIDDSMSSRLVLRNTLQQYDVDISMVASVDEARDHLKQTKPDAIFLDRHMPGIGGLQALKMFKSDASTASIPVVMFTSLGPDDDPATLLAPGALAVLPKPFTDKALFDIMEKLEYAKRHGGKPPTAAQPKRTPEADQKKLEPMVKAMLNEAVQQQITPLLEGKLTEISRAANDSRLGATGETQVDEKIQAALRPALKQVSEYLTKDYSRRIDELQQSQQRLDQQLTALRQQIDQRFDELKPPPPASSESEDDMQYYVMDSIVEENIHGDDSAWQSDAAADDVGRPAGRGRPGRRGLYDDADKLFADETSGIGTAFDAGSGATDATNDIDIADDIDDGGVGASRDVGGTAGPGAGRWYALAAAVLLVVAVLALLYFMRHF